MQDKEQGEEVLEVQNHGKDNMVFSIGLPD